MIKNLLGKMGFETAKIKATENETAIGHQGTENGENVVENSDIGMAAKDAVSQERMSMEDWKRAIGHEVTAVKPNMLQPSIRNAVNEAGR